MVSQKHLFELPDDIHYLNCAYMSPLMRSVQEAGMKGIKRKADPSTVFSDDFFLPAEEVKQKFGKLINGAASQVAIIPSASYGLKSAISNVPVNIGDHAIVVSDEFPSDLYTIVEWCKQHNKDLKTIEAPLTRIDRAATWNEKILQAINKDTAVVVMSAVHWTDGTKFDLKKIGARCKEMNAYFIVDGSQSVGAIPIDVKSYQIDALVCAAYKWLMAPYSSGVAYYSEVYNNGTPIEDSWMNRSNANDFTKLTKYTDSYKEGAARYNVGEFSNLILLPMLDKALEQVLEWGTDQIQDYCGELTKPLLNFLKEKDYWVEEAMYRPNHLFGFLLPASIDRNSLLQELQKRKVFVSVRGDAIRVSPYLYNEANDINALIEILNSHR